MGAIHIPPLSRFGEIVSKKFGVTTFVETGTFRGDAASWAAGVFRKVITIEARPDYYDDVKQRKSRNFPNIEFLLGDSGRLLAELAPRFTEPCMFWLDAHAGGGNFGNEDICPLMEEIEAINRSAPEHFILVDDSRAFVAPAPPPFVAEVWPSIDRVVMALKAKHDYHIVIINDAIIAVPQKAKAELVQFCIETRPKI